MSRRKRDVSFIKPDEPAFISRMKTQIGYQEGPNIDTKREVLPVTEEDDDDKEDELPQVVVMRDGDLTAEEAAKFQQLKDEGPADLQKRVVFRKPSKETDITSEFQRSDENPVKRIKKDEDGKISSSGRRLGKTTQKSNLLSFNEDEED